MKTVKKSKKEISAKQVGRNVILVIEGQKYSRSVADKKARQEILAKVEAYNKRNSIKKEKEIIKFMLESKQKEAAKPKKETKKVEKQIEKVSRTRKKPATKTLTKEQQIAAAKALLEENNYTVNAKSEKIPTRTRRGREY